MSGIDFDKLANARKALEDRKNSGNDFQKVNFWKPKVGQNKIRILPPWTKEGVHAGSFWREAAQHWNVSDENKAPILCPNKTPDLKLPCPICEFVAELKADKKNVQAQELAKELRAKTTWFFNIVDLSDSVYTVSDVAEAKTARPDSEPAFAPGDLKVQVFAAGAGIFNDIVTFVSENKLDITLIDGGHDINITKSGKGLNTEYTVTVLFQPSTLKGWTPETKVNDLAQVGFQQEYGKILEALTAGKGGDYTGSSAPKLTKGKTKEVEVEVEVDDDALPESWTGPAEPEDMAAALEAEMLAEARKAG